MLASVPSWILLLRGLGIALCGFTIGLYVFLGPSLIAQRRKMGLSESALWGIKILLAAVAFTMLAAAIDLAARWNHPDITWRSPSFIILGTMFSAGLLLVHKKSVQREKEEVKT